MRRREFITVLGSVLLGRLPTLAADLGSPASGGNRRRRQSHGLR
jgi:hypothetical protein